MLRRSIVVLELLLAACTCKAEVKEIKSTLDSIALEKDESRLPKLEDVTDQFSSLISAPQEDIKDLLPSGQKCLQSSKRAVQRFGLLFFMTVTMRGDSSQLLDPYFDDVAPFLGDADEGVRNVSIFILASGNPSPPPKALAHLTQHLADKGNSEPFAAALAAASLKARPSDRATVHAVLDLVAQRQDLKLRADVTQMLGLYRVIEDEALAFIGDGLKNADLHVRGASILALEQMASEVQRRFTSELQRLADDQSENSDIRSRALQILKRN
jgi:hypothetical protein